VATKDRPARQTTDGKPVFFLMHSLSCPPKNISFASRPKIQYNRA